MAKKTKQKQVAAKGILHVCATFNNTIVTITDMQGNVLFSSSGGASGYKGTRKSTPFAAQVATEKVTKMAMDHGMQDVDVHIKGPGGGREAAVRAAKAAGMGISLIRDVTGLPHNGCRPKRMRRV